MAGRPDRFESPQTKLAVSGEGLPKVGPETLNDIADILREFDIELSGVDETDIEVRFEHFAEHGLQTDLGHMAIRTWSALMRARTRPENQRKEGFPQDIYISEYALSYRGLDRAVRNRTINNIERIGKGGVEFISGVLDSIEPPEDPADP